MERLDEDTNKPMIRDSMGKFAEGNKEGRKFPKGYAGRPKGVKNRKTIIAREFAYDVLHTNPETGEKMTYKQLVHYISRKADASPRILNLLIDHYLGKPIERVEQEIQTIHIITDGYPSTEKKELGEEGVINVEELQESRKELVEAQNNPDGED
jgi:hypothetical protein